MLASPTSVMFLGYSRSCSPPIGSQPTLNHADLRCRKRVEPLAYEPLRNLCWFLPWGVPGSFLSALRETRGDLRADFGVETVPSWLGEIAKVTIYD